MKSCSCAPGLFGAVDRFLSFRYRISSELLAQTFAFFRLCGKGRHECQVVWTSPWANPTLISAVVHPRHRAHRGGFEIDSMWLTEFWLDLARMERGIRLQAHTHPREAFHSETDDAYPMIPSIGFLSLVIPNLAMGPVGFEDAYLTEIQVDGSWRQVSIESRLEVIP